jgi:hypothetical protein
MGMPVTLNDSFLSIGKMIVDVISNSKRKLPIDLSSNHSDLDILLENCRKHPYIIREQLEEFDIICIGYLWYIFIEEADTSYNILHTLKIFFSASERYKQLSRIANLMNKKIFILNAELRRYKTTKSYEVQINDLVNENMSFHPDFIIMLLNNDLTGQEFNGYTSNQDLLKDWFSYVGMLQEIIPNKNDLSYQVEVDHCFLTKLESLKETIETRTNLTKINIPLLTIQQEYQLSHTEMIMLIYTLKENIHFRNPEQDDLIKLISSDYVELYYNRSFLSEDSNLIRQQLLQPVKSSNPIFMTSVTEYKVNDYYMKEVLDNQGETKSTDKTFRNINPNKFFDIIQPQKRLHHLVLPDEIQNTISSAIYQFTDEVENVLEKWGVVSAKKR